MTARSTIVLALLAPATAAAQGASVQPGDWTDAGCTLGWLFDGSDGSVYFSSAAHCAAAGQEIRIADPAATEPTAGEVLGKVAFRGSDGVDAALDVALIRVRAEMAPRVAGELRGHPGVPTGVISPLDASSGDGLRFSGWGTGFEAAQDTRERRQGVFFDGDELAWEGLLPTTGGDSGGPVAHEPTGAALGVNKGGRCGITTWACAQYGPSVAALERLAAQSGLRITLRRAGAPAPASPAPDAGRPDPAATPQEPTAAAATVAIGVRKLSARALRRKRRLGVTLSPSRALTDVSVLLVRAGRTVAYGTARTVASPARVQLTARRTVRAGRHRLVVTATDDLGRPVRARRRADLR